MSIPDSAAAFFRTASYLGAGSCLAMGAVSITLCVFVVALRFYTRNKQKARMGVDDWLMLPTLVAVIGMGACLLIGADNGALGKPLVLPNYEIETILNFQSPERELSLKLLFAFTKLNVLGLGLVKLSIVCFYRRIFCSVGTQKDWFHWATLASIYIMIAWTISFFFAFLFSCGTNFYAQWGTNLDNIVACPAHQPLIIMGFTISDMIIDLFILFLPLPKILHLQIPLRQKVAISCIFMLGSIAVVSSIIRVVIFSYLLYQIPLYGNQYSLDQVTVNTMTLWWSMFEMAIAVVAGCLPTLRFLFKNLPMERFFASLGSFRLLSSLRSRFDSSVGRSSKREFVGDSYKELNTDTSSTSSKTRINHARKLGIESYAMSSTQMHDVYGRTTKNGEIVVSNGFSQRSDNLV
ncbi:hypothetical protein MMC11_004272 [Xylographa trunciseda]|nr:hypothetical protein [Xylographa trunciseda]